VRYLAKFSADQSIHCEYMASFLFFKTAAVHHIRFVTGILGPPTKST